jgi:hypothetical protein
MLDASEPQRVLDRVTARRLRAVATVEELLDQARSIAP